MYIISSRESADMFFTVNDLSFFIVKKFDSLTINTTSSANKLFAPNDVVLRSLLFFDILELYVIIAYFYNISLMVGLAFNCRQIAVNPLIRIQVAKHNHLLVWLASQKSPN